MANRLVVVIIVADNALSEKLLVVGVGLLCRIFVRRPCGARPHDLHSSSRSFANHHLTSLHIEDQPTRCRATGRGTLRSASLHATS